MIVSNEEKTQKLGKNTDSSGMISSIPLPTGSGSFPDYDAYTHDRGCTGDEGVETNDYNDYDFQYEPVEDVITVVRRGQEKEVTFWKKGSKRSFETKIEDVTATILTSNELFDEIDRDSFAGEVQEIFDRLDDSAKEKLTDQELKTRIKKLAAVEVSSGLLNDLTKEEKKKFMKIETSREIKRLRKELDLTQKQLAELIGVTSRSVSRWESGDSEPSPVVQKSIRRWIHLLDELKDTFEEEALREWFHRPNDSLDGKTPFEVACEIGGENRLRNLLERTEWGIPG